MFRTMTRGLSLLAVVAILMGGLMFTPHGASASASWTPDKNECAFLADLNAYRKAKGLKPVTMSRTLGAAADYHSAYMARTDDVDHTLGSTQWYTNITNYGYPTGQAMGENVLAGRQSASGALSLWKSSAGHNANMLDPKWVTVGVGRVVNLKGRYGFYWTTTFGAKTNQTVSC